MSLFVPMTSTATCLVVAMEWKNQLGTWLCEASVIVDTCFVVGMEWKSQQGISLYVASAIVGSFLAPVSCLSA